MPVNQAAISLRRKAVLFSESIRIEQTVFALPFAYLTLFLAEGGVPGAANFVWITLAMAGARTFGMAANRLIDAEIDARNPRTSGRAMPRGQLTRGEMAVFMAASFGAFLVAVYQLESWVGYLWPIAIAVLTLYPYLKRITWLCHFGLSLVYGMVPAGVWLAVTNELTWGPVLLGTGAGAWVAGFDVIYATQDIDHDRRDGLFALPARFGLATSLTAAKVFHLCAVAAIAGAGLFLDAGALYFAGVAAFLLLVVYEHRLVSPHDLSRVNVAFFNMNGMISVVFFLFVLADMAMMS